MSKTFKADLSHLNEMVDYIAAHAEKSGLLPRSIARVQLAAEEALSNILTYAYPFPDLGNSGCMLTVSCESVGKKFIVEFQDNGMQFNPLEFAIPSDQIPATEKVEGLGIYLIRKMMDELEYHYQDSKNILRMKKNIP